MRALASLAPAIFLALAACGTPRPPNGAQNGSWQQSDPSQTGYWDQLAKVTAGASTGGTSLNLSGGSGSTTTLTPIADSNASGIDLGSGIQNGGAAPASGAAVLPDLSFLASRLSEEARAVEQRCQDARSRGLLSLLASPSRASQTVQDPSRLLQTIGQVVEGQVQKDCEALAQMQFKGNGQKAQAKRAAAATACFQQGMQGFEAAFRQLMAQFQSQESQQQAREEQQRMSTMFLLVFLQQAECKGTQPGAPNY